MKVLVVGSGGREHALAWKLSQSPLVDHLYVAPGNPGMLETRGIECLALGVEKIPEFCREHRIDFVVVGPDQALADGLVDQLSAAGVLAFGPTRAAAELEWSKAFAKDLMQTAGVPTARFFTFSDFAEAADFVKSSDWPGWAIKADGLALGKGVVVARDRNVALAALEDFLVKKSVGESGACVVVEELMEGPEVSAFFLCDSESSVPLGYACDYKQLRDGGLGPNTGGMGAYTPVDWLKPADKKNIASAVVAPVLKEMQTRGRPFCGILFVGLMMTKNGPKVLEFNARFGDPETQALMPTIEGDFLPWLLAASRGELADFVANHGEPKCRGSAVHLVLAAHGYPGTEGVAVRKGDSIQWESSEGVEVFFAGVARGEKGLVTSGGRVMGLTAVAKTRQEARARVYAAAEKVHFAGRQNRGDVGL